MSESMITIKFIICFLGFLIYAGMGFATYWINTGASSLFNDSNSSYRNKKYLKVLKRFIISGLFLYGAVHFATLYW